MIRFNRLSDYTNAGDLDKDNILLAMEGMYEDMSDIMLAAVYGDADREFKLSCFLPKH